MSCLALSCLAVFRLLFSFRALSYIRDPTMHITHGRFYNLIRIRCVWRVFVDLLDVLWKKITEHATCCVERLVGFDKWGKHTNAGAERKVGRYIYFYILCLRKRPQDFAGLGLGFRVQGSGFRV